MRVCMRSQSLQTFLTLCNPMGHSPPGSSVHGILQARILESVAISSSRGSSQPRDQTHVSCVSCIGRWILHHTIMHAAAAKSQQSCPTLCDRLLCPWDSPGKNTGVGCHFFSKAWKRKVKVKSLSHVPLLATPRTVAFQAPPSMGFSRQEYWNGSPLPSPIRISSSKSSLCPRPWNTAVIQPPQNICNY